MNLLPNTRLAMALVLGAVAACSGTRENSQETVIDPVVDTPVAETGPTGTWTFTPGGSATPWSMEVTETEGTMVGIVRRDLNVVNVQVVQEYRMTPGGNGGYVGALRNVYSFGCTDYFYSAWQPSSDWTQMTIGIQCLACNCGLVPRGFSGHYTVGR